MRFVLTLLLLVLPAAAIANDCTDLATMKWGGFTIDSAEAQEATDSQPAHCKVEGTIDTEIHFQLLLPKADAWNGRFVMGGGGGYVGTVQNQALNYTPDMLARGFATVGTDTGHKGTTITADWALNREDREINFGHRAIHVTAETAKTIIRLFYNRDIAYSYFVGCSRGGGQAMMESQRYPDDFDGIVAGAPAYNWAAIGAQFVQISQAMYPDSVSVPPVLSIPARKLLEDAILEQCDAQDGLQDGILNDPRTCDFKPEDLPRCAGDKPGDDCITDQQLSAIKAVYDGPTVNGKNYFPGFPFGGETHVNAWGSWIVGAPNIMGSGTPSLHYAFGTEFFKYLVFDDPDWHYLDYDFSTMEQDVSSAQKILTSADPDLTAFKVAGGKIIYWTGWVDSALTPLGTIKYFNELHEHTSDAESFSRLFMLPGVTHCALGPGPDRVDWLDAIQNWVENDKAPEQLTASKVDANGETLMQRPVCAYPAYAQHNGEGEGNNVEEFECVMPDSQE